MKQFLIKGLDCANCAAKLERALQQIEGIREVSLDFMGQKIVYESDLPEEEVLRLMKDVAKKVEPDAVIEKIHHHHHHHHDHDCQHTRCNCDEHVEHEHSKVVAVKGLDCANCAAKLERALQNTEGFSHVSLDFMGQKIYYESSFSTHDAIKKMQAVADEVEEGVVIEALHQEEHSHDHDHGMDDVRMMLVRIIVALICFVASYIVKQPIWEGLLLIVSYLVIGYDIIWRSIKNILKGKMLDENFLMTFATFGAIYVQQYHEAVAVMLFYQVGELFQTVAVNRSRQSITELMDLRPDVANLKVGEEVKEVHPETLKIGDLVVVYPGEKIPVDGVIVEGTTSLDTSMLTGESMPQDKDVNDPVLSGCVNLSAMITVKVQKEFTESTASKIL
ncbi:MAG: cation transporter, partial [Erysipelotrichaceae bacterium]|nr:cation transporter [Erysipelotrichaceae bacterium]